MHLRILSYNIHKGRAFLSRRKTWQDLLTLLKGSKPDLIFLQEFLREAEAEHFLETLADEIWPHHSFGKNAMLGDYHYGNAILSKYPLLESHNTDISNSALERRGMLYAQIQPERGHRIHLCCCHLDLTSRGREQQIEKMSRTLVPLIPAMEPLLLVGDFNDWQENLHPIIEDTFQVKDSFVTLTGKLLPSAPSLFPIFSLDRVYYRSLEPVRGEYLKNTPWHLRSDHLPLVVDFSCGI